MKDFGQIFEDVPLYTMCIGAAIGAIIGAVGGFQQANESIGFGAGLLFSFGGLLLGVIIGAIIGIFAGKAGQFVVAISTVLIAPFITPFVKSNKGDFGLLAFFGILFYVIVGVVLLIIWTWHW